MQNLVTQFFSVDHERLDFLFRMYRENKKNQRYKDGGRLNVFSAEKAKTDV